MWSYYPPGQNPCAPNTDNYDCGWRPAKRYVRIGAVAESDTCSVESHAFNPTAEQTGYDHNELCSDFSDDLLHNQDLWLRHGTSHATKDEEQCGRGTQTAVCKRVATNPVRLRLATQILKAGSPTTSEQ